MGTTFIYKITFTDEKGYYAGSECIDVTGNDETEVWHEADAEAVELCEEYGFYSFDMQLVDAC